ncbi:MAG: ABC transporter ATP-binding protein/permease, partial [Gemmataceae bacterium]|nr:ABC transporter ATP-binding protein/permease [Gemmataceae bacterium]
AWLYLFVALLVNQGRVAGFLELSARERERLLLEWQSWTDQERAERGRQFGVQEEASRAVVEKGMEAELPLEQWEGIWRTIVYEALRRQVGEAAAETYRESLAGNRTGPSGPLGVLPVVVQERGRWTGRFVGRWALWNEWMWQPGSGGNPNPTYLTGLFVIAFALIVVRSLASNTATYLASAVMLDVLTRLRRAIYLHTYRLGSLAIRTGGTEEVEQLFTRQAETVGVAVHACVTLPWRAVPQLAGLLVVILLVHFWLAVSFVVMAVLVWLIGGQVAAYYRREARQGSRQLHHALALLLESLRLVRLMKCYQLERFNQNRVERQLAECGRAIWRKLRGDALAGPLLQTAGLLGGVGLLYVGGWSVLAGESAVAGLAVLTVALVGLTAAVTDLLHYRARWRRALEAADAILEYLERKGEAAEAVDAEYLPPLRQRIEWRNVSVYEPGTNRHLLENLNFAVPAGAKVAFVGPDRRALRSLAYLLARFFDPTQGEIRIDDKNIRWVTHESLR